MNLTTALNKSEVLSIDQQRCIIDPLTRTIRIPDVEVLAGVEHDKKANVIYFECPLQVDDNFNMKDAKIFVNFRNANGDKDRYIVDDVTIEGDLITFSWLLSHKVTKYRGQVDFIVCAIKNTADTIDNEWNTTLAKVNVLEGLEPDPILEDEIDVVAQLIDLAKDTNEVAEKNYKASQDLVAEAKKANTNATENINKAQDLLNEVNKNVNVKQINKNKEDIASLTDKVKTNENNIKGLEYKLDVKTNINDVLEAHFGLMRNGKVYQTRFYKYAVNPTSAGDKLLDNKGLVCEPSTDTVEGQDDYENIPLFMWSDCNYVREDDGFAIPTAFKGNSDYKDTGNVDVGVIGMSFYYAMTEDDDYQYITISDSPHPELGLKPFESCIRADGTVMPYYIHSKYISSLGDDGKPRSLPNKKMIRKVSHNNMITEYQKKGKGYWGAGVERNTLQIIMIAIKYATKNSQTVFQGVTNYNFQYKASIERTSKETYFPITNAQAGNIQVGTYVSVGYGVVGSNVENIDRGQDSIHAYADDVKVLRIETLDANNKAVYLDCEPFDTQHKTSNGVNLYIYLTSMHARSGETDKVIGHHDGSPVSNTDAKHPYRVQGLEYACGAYTVASNVVTCLNADFTKDVYHANAGTPHSTNESTIKSTYEKVGTMPFEVNNSDWWIGDYMIVDGTWFPFRLGGSNINGVGDRCYAGGNAAKSGTREYLQGGYLGNGSNAGFCFLNCWDSLAYANWASCACD